MSVEAALGLMIGFATLVVTIIFGILALVLDNKNRLYNLKD
ncbi:putative holin-like toxin [Enterococcus faecalis]